MSKISQLATELTKELQKISKTNTQFDEAESASLTALVNTMDDAGMVDIEEDDFPDDEDFDEEEEEEGEDPDFEEPDED